jgi:hypothetical protein
MKRTSLIAVIHAACVAISNADIIYNIDFEPPAYTNGQQIGGGSTRTVSDSIPGFSSQALLLHDGGGLSYYAPQPYTTGIHSISWDFGVPVDQSATTIIGLSLFDSHVNVTMGGGPSTYAILYGPLTIGDPRLSVPFLIGEVYSFNVILNLDAAQYDLFLNGNPLLSNEALQFGPDALEYVTLSQNQTIGLQAGFDNFRWEVIPEPSSLLLTLLGGSALALGRRNARIRNKALNHRLHTYG